MFSANQIVLHLLGDYVFQSHWMATTKTKKSVAALAHALVYSAPFLFLTQSPVAMAFIFASHFAIDRWRLARYVVWLKNFLAPPGSNPPWSECEGTGYPKDTPPWLAVWLLIIADNTLHLVCNALALKYGA